MRMLVARLHPRIELAKLALWFNAWKTAWLERRMLAACDLIVAFTAEDAARFRLQQSGKTVVVIPPGYGGPHARPRDLSLTKRVILLLGSYRWIAKRSNLQTFLNAAEAPLHEAGIEVRVVGNMTPAYRAWLARRFPHVTIVGRVSEVTSELEGARLGLIVESAGGGFKLKLLDYLFARLPIAALNGSMAGTLLQPDVHYIDAEGITELTDKIIARIDDIAYLTELADAAYAACAGGYDWPTRGKQFLHAVALAAAARS